MVTAELIGNTANISSIIDAFNVIANSNDVLFLVIFGALVFMMQWGFLMLEGGQVRKKNVNNVMMKNVADWLIGCISWLFIGYILTTSLDPAAFTNWWSNIFGTAPFLVDNGLELATWFFGLVFAATAATIASGGVAERMKFRSYLIASAIITGVFYPLFVFIGPWGTELISFHDYAGSVMVHALGGFLALGLIIALGPRVGRFIKGKPIPMPGHSIPMAMSGAFILAVGWYGFNVGSALALSDISGLVAATTTLAMAGGGLGALLASNKDILFTLNGLVAGLVAICAGTDIVSPISGLIIGIIAGVQVPLVYKFLERKGIDDVCGVVSVHATAGVVGAISAGIFGSTLLGGTGDVNLVEQLLAVGLVALYGTGFGLILGKGIGYLTGGIRVSEAEEKMGLDLAEHHLSAYPEEDK